MDSLYLPGLMQLRPQTPSQRHRFLLLLQSASVSHCLRQMRPKEAASDRRRGHDSLDGVDEVDVTTPEAQSEIDKM